MAAANINNITFQEDDFLTLGFRVRGFDGWQNHNHDGKMKLFRSLYGTSPMILSLVWQELRFTDITEAQITLNTKPIHLLLLYRWMRAYETEAELKTQFNMGVQTIQNWIREMATKVSRLRQLLVRALMHFFCSFFDSHQFSLFCQIDPNWDDIDDGLIYAGSLDGVHYAVDEPRPFSTRHSSHKRGGKTALCYEIVMSIHKPKVKWLNGGFPANKGDREIFKDHGLMHAVRQQREARRRDIRLIADDGYTEFALYDCLSLRNEFDPRDVAQFKNRVLSRHETFNGKTKNYRCLRENFRHSHDLHRCCVESICVTLQYEMDNGLLTLFDAYL